MLSFLLLLGACRSKPPPPPPKTPKAVPVLSANVLKKVMNFPGWGNLEVFHPLPMSDAKNLLIVMSDTPTQVIGDLSKETVVLNLPTRLLRKRGESHSGRCWEAANDLEQLAQTAERMLAFESYKRPVLYADGTASPIAFLAMAQSPGENFGGLVATDMRLKLDFVAPFCGRDDWNATPDNGIITVAPRPNLDPRPDGSRRILLTPENGVDLTPLVTAMPAVGLLADPTKVQSTLEGWLVSPPPTSVPAGPESLTALNLPLRVSWSGTPKAAFVLVSGPGGWSELERAVAAELDRQGVAVIGWDSLTYFWNHRSTEEFGKDLSRLILAIPPEIPVWAGGYGFGASVAPAAILEPAAGSRLAGFALIGPDAQVGLEISPLPWVSARATPVENPVKTLLEAELRPVLCLTAKEQTATGCPASAGPRRTVELPGAQRFGGDYPLLAKTIADFIAAPPPAGKPGEAVVPPPAPPKEEGQAGTPAGKSPPRPGSRRR